MMKTTGVIRYDSFLLKITYHIIEEIGCEFRHDPSSCCKFKTCDNSLCQFQHDNDHQPEEASVK